MTEPATLAVASLTAGLAATIAWLSLPPAPDLNGEAWFKMMLATLLRGRVERAGGTAESWMNAVLRHVPYHPSPVVTEQLFLGNRAAAHRAEDRALIDVLMSESTPEARWRRLFDDDPDGLAARLDDPMDVLGANHALNRYLGPVDWNDLHDWDPMPARLADRLDAHWVLVPGTSEGPDVLGALAGLIPGARRAEGEDGDPARVEAAFEGMPTDVSTRVVLVGQGLGVVAILRALDASPGLRDHTVAVVSVDGWLYGDPQTDGRDGTVAVRDFIESRFTHHHLERESDAALPYLCLQWLDRAQERPGAFGRRLQDGRLEQPPVEPMTRESVQVVDLGPLDRDVDAGLVGQALWTFVAAWTAAHR